MMPNCQNCWGKEPKTAVFLGQHEVPALCEEHLSELERRIKGFRSGTTTEDIIREYMAGNPNNYMQVMLMDEGNTSEVSNADFARELADVLDKRQASPNLTKRKGM